MSPTDVTNTVQALSLQWPVVAIVIGVFVICGFFALKVFREYRKWQTEESDKNRAVQKEREDSWQAFIATQGELNRQGVREMSVAIMDLQRRVDSGFSQVTTSLATHDASVHHKLDTVVPIAQRKGLR